jgi:hypothetical protein
VRQWGSVKKNLPQQRDRQLFEKLKALNADELTEKTKHYLPKEEVNGMMARRDKIVPTSNPLPWEKAKRKSFISRAHPRGAAKRRERA